MKLKITESQFKRLFSESLDNYGQMSGIEESLKTYENAMYELKYIYEKIGIFLREVKTFTDSMIESAGNFGLTLHRTYCDSFYVDNMSVKYTPYELELIFVMNGVETKDMNDDKYYEFQDKLNSILDELENTVKVPSSCDLDMSTTENGINVKLQFTPKANKPIH